MRERMPWWVKVGAKLVLARLPVPYAAWRRLSLFKHGSMEDPSYALSVFRQHFAAVGPKPGFVALELGPGDTLGSLLVARAHGASHVHLIDSSRAAREDVAPYVALSEALRAQGLPSPDVSSCRSLDEILDRCGGTYGTAGLGSLRALPSASVDFVWSQAVLEHVRRRDFLPLQRELRRVLRPDGACSHRIDLEDHLQHRLDSLRFPAWFWENDLVARSGFYTNRLRPAELLALFAEAGFETEVRAARRFETLPTPRSRMAAPFATLPDEELLVSGLDVVTRCAPAG